MTTQAPGSSLSTWRLLRLISGLCALLMFSACSSADTSNSRFVGEGALGFVDSTGRLGIEEIQNPAIARFVGSEGTAPNAGVPSTPGAAFWIKLDLAAAARSQQEWVPPFVLSVAEPRIRKADLFLVSEVGTKTIGWDAADRRRLSGDGFRYPVLFLDPADLRDSDAYLRIETGSSMRGMAWLADLPSFIASYESETLNIAILVGLMTGSLIYLVALGFNLGDRTNLWLGFCVLSTIVYILCNNAILETKLIPGALLLSRMLSLGATMLIYCSFIGFMAQFLRLKAVMPRAYRAANVVALFFAIAAVLCAVDIAFGLGLARRLAPPLGLAGLSFALLLAVLSAFKSRRRALLFFLAWTPAVFGGMSRIMLDLSPASGANPATANSVYVGIVISLVIFSVISSLDISKRERRLRAEITGNLERFRSFAAIGTDTFWEVDRDGRLSFVDGKPIDGAGLTVGEDFLERLSTLASAELVQPLARAMAANQPFDNRRLRLAGENRDVWISLSGRPVLSGTEDETFPAYRGLVEDVTDNVEQEGRRVLEQQMFALGQMAGSVAHEINNLIHPVLNLTKRLRQRHHDDPASSRMIDLIELSSRQAASVVTQILDSARAARWQNNRLPLGEAVQNAIDALAPTLPSSIRLDLALTDLDRPLSVRTGDILQILSNLLSNAAQAMSGSGTIAVSVSSAPGGASLTVSDTGGGMSDAVRRQALNPFFSTRAESNGTGVGLYVVHRIISEYGGAIDIQSDTGSGTVVTLLFPEKDEER